MSKKSRKKNAAKTKKEKVVYYDDNSTIADMSAVPNGRKIKEGERSNATKPRSTFRDKWNTYWSAVRQMLLPMCCVLLVLALLYVFIMLVTGGFSR